MVFRCAGVGVAAVAVVLAGVTVIAAGAPAFVAVIIAGVAVIAASVASRRHCNSGWCLARRLIVAAVAGIAAGRALIISGALSLLLAPLPQYLFY